MPHSFNRTYRQEGKPWDWQQSDKGEKVGYAGLLTEDISEGLAKYFKVEGGADQRSDEGLRRKRRGCAGDVITKIGDKNVDGESDVRRVIRDHKPGDALDFVVMRDGKSETIKVTLGEQTIHTDSGDLFRMEHDSLGGLTLVPDEAQWEKLKEHLNELNLNLNGLGDSLKLHLRNLDIPRIHVNVDEFDNEPIHLHKIIRVHRDMKTA